MNFNYEPPPAKDETEFNARVAANMAEWEAKQAVRPASAREALHNALFRANGTSSPAIGKRRLCMLSIIQSITGWTTGRDDALIYGHLRMSGRE